MHVDRAESEPYTGARTSETTRTDEEAHAALEALKGER